MARSLINRKYSADIEGLLTIENNDLIVSVDDIGDVSLSAFFADFSGKEVKINIAYKEEMGNSDPSED